LIPTRRGVASRVRPPLEPRKRSLLKGLQRFLKVSRAPFLAHGWPPLDSVESLLSFSQGFPPPPPTELAWTVFSSPAFFFSSFFGFFRIPLFFPPVRWAFGTEVPTGLMRCSERPTMFSKQFSSCHSTDAVWLVLCPVPPSFPFYAHPHVNGWNSRLWCFFLSAMKGLFPCSLASENCFFCF